MTRQENLNDLLDAMGRVLADGLNGLPEGGRKAVAAELETGAAKIHIIQAPVMASTVCFLETSVGPLELFAIQPPTS